MEDKQKTHLVVVAAAVAARTDTTEAPGVDKTVERVVIAVFKEQRHHHALKQVRLQDLPGSAVRHPGDNILMEDESVTTTTTRSV